jgi:hypothetical protein
VIKLKFQYRYIIEMFLGSWMGGRLDKYIMNGPIVILLE